MPDEMVTDEILDHLKQAVLDYDSEAAVAWAGTAITAPSP